MLICLGKYLESGEYEYNLYGTKLESIKNVMAEGKMCILDVSPQVSKRFSSLSGALCTDGA